MYFRFQIIRDNISFISEKIQLTIRVLAKYLKMDEFLFFHAGHPEPPLARVGAFLWLLFVGISRFCGCLSSHDLAFLDALPHLNHIGFIMRHNRVHSVSRVAAAKAVRASVVASVDAAIIWTAILPHGSTGAARPG
jgi:hypothetical protein